MRVLTDADSPGTEPRGQPHWVEHLAVADLSAGTYSIPRAGVDTQTPHSEDEIYVVLRGRGTLATDRESVPVGPGSAIYVPAGQPHHFVDITEELVIFVVFAPAEGSRALR